MTEIVLGNEALKLTLGVADDGGVGLTGLATARADGTWAADDRAIWLCRPYPEYAAPLVEVQLSGDDTPLRHDNCHGGTQAGRELRYVSHTLEDCAGARCLVVTLASARLEVKYHLGFVKQ